MILHNRLVRFRWVALLALLVVSVCSACSPGYLLRGAYEQSKILLARKKIESAIDDPQISTDLRDKLRVVVAARAFAQRIGLEPRGGFTTYATVSRDPLAWVVVASRRDLFALHTWWFPIVGTVPYKGFFEREDADREAADLQAQGYETSIRGTEAFSTLGWFDDPVVSTTLKNSKTRIANTVIHESVHSTVWITGNVAFNESLANFVGSQGALDFFAEQLKVCIAAQHECKEEQLNYAAAKRELTFQFELAEVVELLYSRLENLYTDSTISTAQKLDQRGVIFDQVMAPFRSRYPNVSILKAVNNADIIQLKLYLSQLWVFNEIFVRGDRSWDRFINTIRSVKSQVDDDSTRDPFDLLRSYNG